MLLLFDIGNTTITIGVYKENQILGSWKITTRTKRTADEYTIVIQTYLQQLGLKISDIDDVLVSSVVPEQEQLIIWFCENNNLRKPYIVSTRCKTNINIKLDQPSEVGSDLLVAGVAAQKRWPGKTSIIVDFGTATTVMVLTEEADFLGGAIVPGIEVSTKALVNSTALLTMPETETSHDPAIGSSTQAALRSGIVYGYSGMVDNILKNIIDELKTDNYQILATGGQAQFIIDKSKYICRFEENLIFDGLLHIYALNRDSNSC